MSTAANWFISTKSSGPVSGEIQDSTVGCYELTRSGVVMDKYHAMGLLAGSGVEPPRFDHRKPGHLFAGRDVVSLLLAATPINYRRAPRSFSDVYSPFIRYDPDETLTVIEQGRLVRGVLDKRSVGDGAFDGVFHLISREFGPQRALDAIYAFQQVSLQFLLWRGFTVGTADLLPSPEALAQIRALVSGVLLEAGLVTDRLLRGAIVPPIDRTVHDFYEEQQRAALTVGDAGLLRWILGSIDPRTNGFFRMIAVGSKGTNPNLKHVSGVIGQTEINESRILELFGFRRTSPYFPRFATDPAAYGFVANNYVTGMNSSEFIFQGMNGRFDLINKALSTASTGYFMRKGIMNNQSSVVDNLRHVTKDTRVVQFIYGEDGLDSRELEKVSFAHVLLSDAALRDAAGVDATAGGPAAVAAVEEALAKILEDRDAFRDAFRRLEDADFGQSFSTEMLMPVNVRRIVEGVFIGASADAAAAPANAGAPLTAAAAEGVRRRCERVWDLCRRIPYALVNEIQERRRAPVAAAKTAAASLLCMLIRAELSPRVLARLTDEQLDFVVDAIRLRYCLSLVDYGTAVGILATQALSEPLTQYMLNSHHRSVAGGTNKSGLVRVSEVFGARPLAEEQSPEMQLPLRRPGSDAAAAAAAAEVANSIEFITLQRFVLRHDTLLEPYAGPLVFPAYAGDRAWVDEFERAHPLVRPPGDLTNWCFRFVLDKSALVLKAVDLELIVGRLRHVHGFFVVHTPESVPEIVVRVWVRASQFRRGDSAEEGVREIFKTALATPIRGIAGITRVGVKKLVRRHVARGGELLDADSRALLVGPPREGQKTVAAQVGELVKVEQFAVTTVGTNLYGATLHGAVDADRAISNSINDTLKMYGIEAARAKVISETRSFMSDSAPNFRHIFMYADEMFRTGRYTSVERYGLGSREHVNVLLRMAYGAPVQVVTDAALAGARSRVYGIAAPQMLGSVPQIGTLYNSVVMDEEFIRENVVAVDRVIDELV